MVNEKKLSNAPIKEAVIDIQIAPNQIRIDQIESLTAKMPSGYTDIKPIFEAHMEFQINNNIEQSSGNLDQAIVGYFIKNSNSGFVAQFRETGLTLSKLPPYDEWASFKNEAQQMWSIYQRLAPDLKLYRLAVRYINEMTLPLVGEGGCPINFDDYLTNGPKLPTNMGVFFQEFFNRVVIPWPELKTHIIAIQALKERTTSHATVILDTDIYRTDTPDFSEVEMWDFFDRLRDLKNRVFEGSLTEKTMELFK